MATAELGYRIRSDSVKQASVRLDEMSRSAQRAERSSSELETSSNQVSGSIGRVARGAENYSSASSRAAGASSRFSGQMQNASFQAADLAVQIGAGTSATRALSMQLPQLLGGMGVLGAAIGAVVAVGGAMLPMLTSNAEAAQSLSDANEDLSESTDSYLSVIGSAKQGLEELRDKYGESAEKARELYEVQSQIARREAISAVGGAISSIQSEFEVGARDLISNMQEYSDAIVTLENATGTGRGYQNIQSQIDAFERLRQEYGMTTEQAFKFNQAISELDANAPLQQQRQSLSTIVSLLRDSGGAADGYLNSVTDALQQVLQLQAGQSKVTEEARRSAESALEVATSFAEASASADYLSAVDIASGIDSAAESASGLTRKLRIATSFAQQLAGFAPVSEQDIASGERKFIGDKANSTLQAGIDFAKATAPDVSARSIGSFTMPERSGGASGGSSGGGGVGGMSEQQRIAERAQERRQREAERVYDSTRTAAEKYAIEMQRLNGLREKGLITAETMARAEGDLADRFSDVSYAARDMHRTAGDAFTSIVTGAESATDALSGMLDQFASMAAQSAFNGLFSSDALGGSGLFQTIFGGIDGARAKGGPVSAGGAYLVGEHGPEVFQPRQSGNVIPNGGGAGAPGGGKINVDVGVSVDDDGNLQAYVKRVSESSAAQAARSGIERYDRDQLPRSMKRVQADPARMG